MNKPRKVWRHDGPVGGISVPVLSSEGEVFHCADGNSATAVVLLLNELETRDPLEYSKQPPTKPGFYWLLDYSYELRVWVETIACVDWHMVREGTGRFVPSGLYATVFARPGQAVGLLEVSWPKEALWAGPIPKLSRPVGFNEEGPVIAANDATEVK